MNRWVIKIGKFLGWLFVFLGLVWAFLAIAILFASKSETIRDWALEKAKQGLAQNAQIELVYSKVSGNLGEELTFFDLRLSSKEKDLFKAHKLSAKFSLFSLLGGEINIKKLELTKPWMRWPLVTDEEESKGGPPGLGLKIALFSIDQGTFIAPLGLGPLRKAKDISARGAFKLNLQGPRLDIETFESDLFLDQDIGWLKVTTHGFWENDQALINGLLVSKGKNSVRASGKLDWEKNFSYEAKGEISLKSFRKIPFALPDNIKPEASVFIKLNTKGDLKKIESQGAIKMAGQVFSFSGKHDFEEVSGKLLADLTKVDVSSWGLMDQHLDLTGKLKLDYKGIPFEPKSFLTADFKLTKVITPINVPAEVKLDLALLGKKLAINKLNAAGIWGKLQASGQVDFSFDKKDSFPIKAQASFENLTLPPNLRKHVPTFLHNAHLNGLAKVEGATNNLNWLIDLTPSHLAKGVKVGALSAKGLIKQKDFELDSISSNGSWGSLKAQGKLTGKKVDMQFDLAIPSLAKLEPVLVLYGLKPIKASAKDVYAQGRLSGPFSNLMLDMKASANEIAAFERSAGHIELEVSAEKLGSKPKGKALIKLEDIIEGDIVWKNINISAQLTEKQGNVSLSSISSLGELAFDVSSFHPYDFKKPYTLSKTKIEILGKKAWSQKNKAQISWENKNLSIKGFVLAQQEQSISLDGNIDSQEQVNTIVRLDNIRLAPWLKNEEILEKAYCSSEIKISGILDKPIINVKGSINNLIWPKLEPAKVDFAGGLLSQGVFFEGGVTIGGKKALDWKAELDAQLKLDPLDWEFGPKGLDARIKGENFALALFDPLLVQIAQLGGFLDLDLKIKGPIKDLEANGQLTVKQGELAIIPTGQIFEGINGTVSLSQKRLRVEKLTLKSDGPLTLKGYADLDSSFQQGDIDFELKGEKFTTSLGSTGEVKLDLDLKLKGKMSKPVLTGTIIPVKGNIRLGQGAPPDLKEVVLLKPGQKPPPMQHEVKPLIWQPTGLLGRSTISVKILPPDMPNVPLGLGGWIKLTGKLHLVKNPEGPLTYHDKITIPNGAIIFQGKRFVIDKATLDFAGKEIPDANLSARANITVGTTQIFITLLGTLLDPTYQLSSQPPMSEADILSTIIFGNPREALNSGQSSELTAQALALLGTQGAREIQDLVGDTFTPDVVTVHEEAQSGSSLEAGKYLSPDLYLRYRHNLGQEGGNNVGIEYRMYPWLSLESQVGTTRDTGVDVIFNWDFE